MKRFSLILLAITLSLTATAQGASTTTPPKSVCLTDGNYIYPLTIKPSGTVKMSDGRVKFYNINGEYFFPGIASFPVTGSGHVKGTVFHFSLTGNSYVSGAYWTALLEGSWDLAQPSNPVGTVYVHQISNFGSGGGSTYSLSLTDCSTQTLPYNDQGKK
jgi:hypothetical protein